jgi:hypothetical protein
MFSRLLRRRSILAVPGEGLKDVFLFQMSFRELQVVPSCCRAALTLLNMRFIISVAVKCSALVTELSSFLIPLTSNRACHAQTVICSVFTGEICLTITRHLFVCPHILEANGVARRHAGSWHLALRCQW